MSGFWDTLDAVTDWSPAARIGKAAGRYVRDRYLERRIEQRQKEDEAGAPIPPPQDPKTSVLPEAGQAREPPKAAPRKLPPPQPSIASVKLTVAEQPFATWFNKNCTGKKYPTLSRNPQGEAPCGVPYLYKNQFNEENFAKLDIQALSGKKSVTLLEFLAIIMIPYNELGGSFKSVGEIGYCAVDPKRAHADIWYMLKSHPLYKKDNKWVASEKGSYNGALGNRLAGDQLWARGVFAKIYANEPDKEQKIQKATDDWNSRQEMPDGYPEVVYEASKECDFWKYRGHGMNQLTGRSNYVTHAKPALQSVLGEDKKLFLNFTMPTPDPKPPGWKKDAWNKLPYKLKLATLSEEQRRAWCADDDGLRTDDIEELFLRPEVYYAAYRSFLKKALNAYLKEQNRSLDDVLFENESDVDKYGHKMNAGDYHLLYTERVMTVYRLIEGIGYKLA